MSSASPAAPARVLSGIQPTADSFHFGNYLGALRQWVALQDEFDALYFIADQHAITVPFDPALLRKRVRGSAAQLLALGLDPERSTLFVQSAVPEHAQLAWVLGCLTGFGEASRMTQFKDKSARGDLGDATVGLFTYPILQAADILLYQADRVPVGEDQRQHLELTRVLAKRFNTRFGVAFKVPEPHIPKGTAKVLDLANPEKQMSKSAASPAGLLNLLEDPKSLSKKVRSAVTDSGREVLFDPVDKPGVTNLLTIGGALTGVSGEQFATGYEGRGYGDLKKDVAEIVVEFATGVRERTEEWLAGDRLDEVLAAGSARARTLAAATLADVYERVGFVVPGPDGSTNGSTDGTAHV
jgi:tryptophanyl-tRNA synthetase